MRRVDQDPPDRLIPEALDRLVLSQLANFAAHVETAHTLCGANFQNWLNLPFFPSSSVQPSWTRGAVNRPTIAAWVERKHWSPAIAKPESRTPLTLPTAGQRGDGSRARRPGKTTLKF
jgi:hypothetical protein